MKDQILEKPELHRDWNSDHVTASLPTVLPAIEPRIVYVRRKGFLGYLALLWDGFSSFCEWIFGAAVLMVLLAFLAVIPILQFLSLGYLLEVTGRIARTGKFSQGFIGMKQGARIGSLVIGTWLFLLPIWLVTDVANSAQLIDPYGPVALRWRFAQIALSIAIGAHILLAWLRGGRFRHFFWPIGHVFWLVRCIRRRRYYTEAKDDLWLFVTSLRLPYYFWLGLRGFVGSLIWLGFPVTILVIASRARFTAMPPLAQAIVIVGGYIGFFLLIGVVMILPFLQARFAAENRFKAMFEYLAVLADYARAPWAFAFALFITLLFSLPLYLLKIEMVPRELGWLPSLFFVASIYPARLLTGWAYGRARKRAPRFRNPFFWFTGWMPMLPAAFIYVFLVYFLHFTAWEGIWSLYEQHAFLVPVPFMSM